MPHPGTNERKYPHIVELAVGEDSLDVGLGRRIILREGKTYYRWCFPDLATAREFMEQFGGGTPQPNGEVADA
jgi:hypothetical protein